MNEMEMNVRGGRGEVCTRLAYLWQHELLPTRLTMSIFHDEVEIEDFEYDEETDCYYYPCPCGDQFQITRVSLHLFTAKKVY